ncbi:calmodulin-binding protein 60 A-like [Benincasa hispida]|uniref:calmodulin-binding protein 60 A-like n=1 Tax=Benincasa hispida TaxID=102211 RepID=UPI0018FF9B62|nr:calmodulin-binding protein 60 A-like [Benincasa hispida]
MNAFHTHFPPHLLESLRERKETREAVIKKGGMEKYKLVYCNEPASIIFTNNDIKAENGEPLKVVILDTTTNAIICTGLLSSAKLEFFLLDGDYGVSTGQQQHHPLSPRDGKRPLLLGNDLNLNLQNGVATIHSLSITDNSSWIKSKKFCLGVKIRDDKILPMFDDPTIPLAVSQPFRVMDHRGEVNKKHHPPSREDELWRLEGIGKDGAYHKNLCSHNIKTVGDFLKAYQEMGPTSLKKLLGIKVPKKTWLMMVANAKECVNPPSCEQTSKVNEWAYKIMGDESPFNQGHEDYEQKNNLGYGSSQIPRMDFVEDFAYGQLGHGGFSPWVTVEALTSNIINDFGPS